MIGGGLGMGAPRAPSLCPLCPYLHETPYGVSHKDTKKALYAQYQFVL